MVPVRSADFQEVFINGIITYRIANPEAIVNRLDFSLDVLTGKWEEDPRDKIDSLLTQVAQSAVVDWASTTNLEAILENGITVLRDQISQRLEDEPAVQALGLEIVSVRIADVKPNVTVERAMQTPVLEQLQMRADKATAERRMTTVQNERTITEAEQNNQLAQAEKQSEVDAQVAANQLKNQLATIERQRVAAEAQNEATIATAKANAEADHISVEARVKELQAVGAAKAEAEKALLEAQQGENAVEVLRARAFAELGKNVKSIGSLQIGGEVVNKLVNEIEDQVG